MLGLGAYGGSPTELVRRVRPSLLLAHECPGTAEAAADANPNSYRILRADDGDDNNQPVSGDPKAAARWWAENKVKPKLARARPGTYNAVSGFCERIAGGKPEDEPAHIFRGAMEYELACIVQDELGLDYVCLASSVGNIEAYHIKHYAAAIQKSRWTNPHLYLAIGRTRAAEEDFTACPWFIWRPLAIWLEELRRLGVKLRLLPCETGTYDNPESMGISRAEMLRQCIVIDQMLGTKCAELGVEYGGSIPFGFGTVGSMEVWNLAGTEGIYPDWSQPLPWGTASNPVDPAPPQPETPTGDETVTVGQGFQKAADLVQFTEDEIYHANDSPEKTSLAIGAKGYATYRARSNQTVVVLDDGRILSDFGNESKDGGKLHQVYPFA